MSQLRPPPQVLEIARRLEARGFEAWCVGGAIRDVLLGQPHLDWDFATSARPEDVRALFGHNRTIPVGVEFGTVGVLDPDGVMHEVTTFRRDVRTDGRHAEVEFGVSLEDDLARRDFTINAIAYSPSRDELRDPFGGQADIRKRVVRAVGDPQARMREDRLRALRAIRFSARFEFEIERETLDAIRDSAPHLERLSAERVKQELEKTVDQVCRPSRAFSLWKSTGAFSALIPSLAAAGDDQLSVSDFLAMPGPLRRPNRRIARLAALFSTVDAGDIPPLLTNLRFSRQEAHWIGNVVGKWQAGSAGIVACAAAGDSADDAAVRELVARIGRLHVGGVMRLAMATWAARRASGRDAPSSVAGGRLYRRMLRSAFRDPIELRDLAVDGDDLKRAGVSSGPGLGRILQSLLRQVLEEPSRNQTDWLLQEAMRLDRNVETGTTERREHGD